MDVTAFNLPAVAFPRTVALALLSFPSFSLGNRIAPFPTNTGKNKVINVGDELLGRKSKVFAKDPFYSVYGLGDWNSKYKVAWKSMGFFPDFMILSAVVDEKLGKKLILPEHVINFIPVRSETEAHYVCATLNSHPVRVALKALSSKSKAGLSASIIKKIRLDRFDPGNCGIERKKMWGDLSFRDDTI